MPDDDDDDTMPPPAGSVSSGSDKPDENP
jgi:hypothetical protein